jgi:hypothetical protein
MLSQRVTVYVADGFPPTIEITSPAADSTLGKSATLTAAADDNVGVVGVQFLVDGQRIGGEITSAPYTLTWSTRWVSKGPHLLTAVARDAAGNLAFSPSVNVTIMRGRTD